MEIVKKICELSCFALYICFFYARALAMRGRSGVDIPHCHQRPNSLQCSSMENKKTVDNDTLEKLLYLSRLSPESTDLTTLKKQVDDIVGYFDILSKYDDSENPYDAYPSTQAEALREDSVVAGLDIPDVKKVTENFMDGYFQVPKVLGEGA